MSEDKQLQNMNTVPDDSAQASTVERRSRAPSAASARSTWWPLAASAGLAALVVAVIIAVLPREPSVVESPEAFEIISNGEELEFYDEMDLYAWMAEGAEHGPAR